MNKKTTIINLYGGPGIGKSTSAAYIFANLKQRDLNAELVQEYVKGWAWEKRNPRVYDQLYFLGKQIRAESMLYGRADYVVTDSPVALNIYYTQQCSDLFGEPAKQLVRSFYEQSRRDGHEHVHVLLERSKAYNPAGRYHTYEQSQDIDDAVRGLLEEFGYNYIISETNTLALAGLVERLVGIT